MVNKLVELEVDEVSYVKKGANGKKFHIMKNFKEKEGEDTLEKIEKTIAGKLGEFANAIKKASEKLIGILEGVADDTTEEYIKKSEEQLKEVADEITGYITKPEGEIKPVEPTADTSTKTPDKMDILIASVNSLTEKLTPKVETTVAIEPVEVEVEKSITLSDIAKTLEGLSKRMEKIESVGGIKKSIDGQETTTDEPKKEINIFGGSISRLI